MKRCIADIPIVTHIQKESAGMNKLYSQSMCSVKQWQAFQHAEAMVSQEVTEVRAEADEIEPGWSQVSCDQIVAAVNAMQFSSSCVRLVWFIGHLEARNAVSQHAQAET